MRSYEDVMEFVEVENVKFIRLAYVDALGVMKNLAVMPEELERVFRSGVSIDASAIRGYGAKVKSDLYLHPDPETLQIVPWRPMDGRVARMFCEIRYPDGTVFERDPRYILRQAVKKAREAGIQLRFGAEMEFYLFKLDEEGMPTQIPMDRGGYMDVAPEDQGENIRREICFAMMDMGFRPESSHHEDGPGQNEVDFRSSTPLHAADDETVMKWIVKSVSKVNGVWADFSPKPMRDQPGNGMHVNITVKKDDGTPVRDAFMAGIMDHIREITLFLDPVKESYDRLGGHKAPYYISWGDQNRTTLIRIPSGKGHADTFELRSPDPMCNPYIVYALLIHAGLDGIARGLDLQAPTDVDLHCAPREETEGLRVLPEKLEEAVALAAASPFVRGILPEDCLEAYGAL